MNAGTLQPSVRAPYWRRRFAVMSRRANLFAWLEGVAVVATVGMVVTTYLAFTSAPPNGQLLPSMQVAGLLIGTLIPAMALIVLIGRRLAMRRAGGSTARLHVRLVFFFSLVAAVPTLLVAAFAALLFQSGVDFWFSDNSRGLMANANQLAQGYYNQNQLEVGNETVIMAGDLRYYFERGSLTDSGFADFYRYQAQGREMNESAILQAQPDGTYRTAAILNLSSGDRPIQLLPATFGKLQQGEPVVVLADNARIEALAPIDREAGIYLYNARNSESLSFSQWESAKSITRAYEVLTSRARALQLRFNLALFVVSLALVGLAVWFALRFADMQVQPLTDLVVAARKVGAGNFALRVEGRTGSDEIGMLNRAFNRMTAQLEKQTDALVGANHLLGERRAFIEAVLQSITAGILSVDSAGRIVLMNASAQALLLDREDVEPGDLTLAELAPQMEAIVQAGLDGGIVSYNRGGELLTLAVRIAHAAEGQVITFEDITRQLLDQRQAAWSDVARRIAHEIKNPLTPIQLATERLKRRYRRQIETDGDLFDELTDTIVRQVGALRTMVDEFSSFARLPKPVFRQEDVVDLVRQALFLQEVAHPEIRYAFSAQNAPELVACDRHQIGQAMTNLLKNAAEAVDARLRTAGPEYRGQISVDLVGESADYYRVTITDNGIGLPHDAERIVEPYVTTREKGTGLGLAIVNKIVEEHGGEMLFGNADTGGAVVTLRIATQPVEAGDEVAA